MTYKKENRRIFRQLGKHSRYLRDLFSPEIDHKEWLREAVKSIPDQHQLSFRQGYYSGGQR